LRSLIKKGNTMKIQSLLIAGLILVPCFAANAKVTKAHEGPVVTEGAECLAMPTPMMEKVSTRCSVHETAPAQCFTIKKVVETDETYKIPGACVRQCSVTDENGTHPCGCEKPCACKTEHRCNRCAK
jgi:hypothetical protein